jgi:23S rRNA (cytidine1920-2'-O)/16S rRNA (cytidine1409-2'-O)-methyltransferase
VLDVGASTGGFTDALLQRGAAQVIALDVGRGQLDWSLRNDPRVAPLEGVNVRYLDPDTITEPLDLIVVDVSFISLSLVLPVLSALLAAAGTPRENRGPRSNPPPLPAILALVKPQFEVGRGQVGRGGVVRDPELQASAVRGVIAKAAAPPSLLGAWRILESPLRGAEGNREFFVCFVPGYDRPAEETETELRAVVEATSGKDP